MGEGRKERREEGNKNQTSREKSSAEEIIVA